jgi:hypothetical protein
VLADWYLQITNSSFIRFEFTFSLSHFIDSLYWEHLFEPLLNTLLQLTAPSAASTTGVSPVGPELSSTSSLSSSSPSSDTTNDSSNNNSGNVTTVASSSSSSSSSPSSMRGVGVGPIIWLTQTPRRNKIEQRFFKSAQRHFIVDIAHRTKYKSDDRTFVTIYRLQRKQLSTPTSSSVGGGASTTRSRDKKSKQTKQFTKGEPVPVMVTTKTEPSQSSSNGPPQQQ